MHKITRYEMIIHKNIWNYLISHVINILEYWKALMIVNLNILCHVSYTYSITKGHNTYFESMKK